ncbi:MAG: lysylphosphatidylglycerol synthase transmembrane domain-containing protein [Alphaproteobacteria bacterium]
MALSAGILLVLILRVDYTAMQSMMHRIDITTWGLAFVFIFAQILALSVRWNLLVNVEETRMDFMTSLRITLVSFLANYLFITSAGGIVARIALSVNHGISLVKSVVITLIDRLMTLFALGVLALIFLFEAQTFLNPKFINSTLIFSLLLFFLAVSALLVFAYNRRREIIFSNRKIAMCSQYLRTFLTNSTLLSKVIGVSLFGQIMYFAAVYVVIESLGINLPLIKFMAIIPFITLVASLPLGYGGWGIREGAFMYGLGLINLPLEASFTASVQIGLISMVAALVTGVPAFFDTRTQSALKGWRKKPKTEK